MFYEIELENGKYTFMNDNGVVRIFRYDDPWKSGDKSVLALLQQIQRYEEALEQIAGISDVSPLRESELMRDIARKALD